ncbi:alpha/beta fold hydrolase [Rhodococcus triatomae]|uniref:Triacylglycerol lipase n=1 Tax=Rhodococcus triatomae TaxID=300028 RepID=A0A1G8ID06_9NOCA|nr:alpha/beta fold hydrolase [Rhodococcus triatomae]QNG21021.1 alpha/beta fold hydrolase [Rhodococcus triatomae]QNG23064.1 alpha/beta fold hydrolase [Rhodococcus triatomae]SDI16795.1 triacylglycerol lipase [Rhodococcus triatomae]
MPITFRGGFRRFRAVAALAAAGLLLAAGTATAHAEPIPENYNFFAGIPNELADPGGSLPGSNDFECEPTAERPRPVVLAHGTGGSQQTNWGAYVPMLANAGFCVFALTYGAVPGAPWPLSAIGGMAPMEDSAREFGDFVDRVLDATGAESVDVIGHSQGTVVPTYYLKHLGGEGKISRYVSIAPAWSGTTLLGADALGSFARELGIDGASLVPICQACGQVTAGSDLLAEIASGGTPYVPGVEYTNIATRYDQLVVPYTQGLVPGPPGYSVRNIVVQDTCDTDYSDHLAIAGSQRAAYLALNALDPDHPRPVPCTFVPPFTG